MSPSRLTRVLARCLVSLVAAGTVSVISAAPAAAASCTLNSTNGTITRFIGLRTYTVHVPPGLTGQSVPLMLALHGQLIGTSKQHESDTGWSPYADSHNFIVAYPQAIGNWWDLTGSGDINYLRAVVDNISASWCVDQKAVFAEGHSAGAYMSQRIACDAADKFASVVTYAGSDATLFGPSCNPSRPIGVGMFHGLLDTTVPWIVDQQSANLWKGTGRNNCTASAKSFDSYGTLTKYTSCSAGVSVWLRLLYSATHLMPQGATAADQRNKMWSFLTANRMP
ncbi:MAG TPA: hypothetical protein DGT23_07560 [Micromonosporaceae bacterium]|nr:hypothetical protein [Micromonosporaceae bacterium]